MAKNQMTLDTSGLEAALARLVATVSPARARQVVEENLEKIGQKVSADTSEAVEPGNLPAGGIYSHGATAKEVIKDAKVTWDGDGVAWIPLGFDWDEPGVGGWLISGTPKYDPNPMLRRMFKGKRYMKDLQDELATAVWSEIINEEGR